MKKIIFGVCAAVLLTSCIRKPEACLSADKTNVKLGEPVTFTDCSDKAETIGLDFGDGTNYKNTKSFTHSYRKPGTFTATLTAWSKKLKKSDVATVAVTVQAPEKSELIGKWNYYKQEEYVTFFFSEPTTPTATYLYDSDYDFLSNDSLIVTDKANNYIYEYTYIFSTDGLLSYNGTTYEIAKLYNNEMVLRSADFAGDFTLYYFKKY